MKQYRLVNNIVGWLIFAVAAFTYCSTIDGQLLGLSRVHHHSV